MLKYYFFNGFTKPFNNDIMWWKSIVICSTLVIIRYFIFALTFFFILWQFGLLSCFSIKVTLVFQHQIDEHLLNGGLEKKQPKHTRNVTTRICSSFVWTQTEFATIKCSNFIFVCWFMQYSLPKNFYFLYKKRHIDYTFRVNDRNSVQVAEQVPQCIVQTHLIW